MSSLAFLGLFIWTVFASYSYLFRTEILAAKNLELIAAENNYVAANDQFDELKNDIQKTTRALEQRQIYLQQLLDADKTLVDGMAPVQKSSDNKKILPGNISFDFDLSDEYMDHQKHLTNLHFSIDRIEQQQHNLAGIMIERLSGKIAYVENTLKQSGLKSDLLIQLAENRPSQSLGMGGPFILYADSSDVAISPLSSREPFARLYAQYNRLIDLESAVQHIPVGIPAKKYYISSSFGIRKDPFKKKWARHNGVDMAGWWKTPIYASANGIVTKAGRNGAYGNFIEIDHGNGFRSRYGHLSRLKVKKGEQVTLEQTIGLMGSTGRSTSPHLHYEIWFNGKPINPQKIFKASDNVLKIQRQEYDS